MKKLNSLFKIKKYCGVRTYYIFKKLEHIKMYDFCGQIVSVSFHSKCKVLGQRSDTVQQFREPGQRSVPRFF